MAEKFKPQPFNINNINGGKRYQNGDGVTAESINATIEASAFAQSIATNQPDISNIDGDGVPSISITQNSNGEPILKFENLVGQDGKTPYIGANGNWWIGETDSGTKAQGEKGIPEFIESVNKFNINDDLSGKGAWMRNGDMMTSSSEYWHTHPIKVYAGKSYKWPHYSAYGNNKYYAKVNDKCEFIASAQFDEITADGYAILNATEDGYISVNIQGSGRGGFMFCELDKYPTVYIKYENLLKDTRLELFDKQISELDRVLSPETTNYINRVRSKNLFDCNSEAENGYFNVSNGNIVTNSTDLSYYVPIEGSGNYRMLAQYNIYGSSISKLLLFDKDKRFIRAITAVSKGETGAIVSNMTEVEHSITEAHINEGAVFFGYSFRKNNKSLLMIVKDEEYPTEYIPYENYLEIPLLKVGGGAIPNILNKKQIAFDGDSICASNSTHDTLSGWAGRIGTSNGMIWKNYAVGGGTITAEQYYANGNARHWVSRTIDSIHAEMPSLDYLILEGGTNDADVLGIDSDKFGTVDETDYSGVYDDTTFCGAVESLFYKALTYFPSAKIGFIIAPKMGKTSLGFGATNKRRHYFLKIIEICKKWGIPYLDLWECCPLNPNILTHYDSNLSSEENVNNGKLYMDGQHPTPKGYDFMKERIEDFIKSI